MVLKEAFTMSNNLERLFQEARRFLTISGNVMQVKETHMRKKANPNAEDEVIMVEKSTEISANDALGLMADLLTEKEKLTAAIFDAKKNAKVNIDAEMSLNKSRREACETAERLSRMQAKTTKRDGTGYLINNEGNQTAYTYEIETVQTIDYDRNKAKAIARGLRQEADEMSRAVDVADVTLDVKYEEKYGIGIDLEEAVEILKGDFDAE